MSIKAIPLIFLALLLSGCSNQQTESKELDLSQTAEICVQSYYEVFSCNPWPVVDYEFCYGYKVIQPYFYRTVNGIDEKVWIIATESKRLQGIVNESCADSSYKYYYHLNFELREPVGEYSLSAILHESMTSDSNFVAEADNLPLGVWAEVKLK
jgi:hypothetical protein